MGSGGVFYVRGPRRCCPACGQSAGFAPGLRCLLLLLSLSCAAGACLLEMCPRASLRRIFRLSFAFFCLTFASQNSFHLSLRPRRASTFFRKESRQRFARGRGSALSPISPFLSLLAGLTALRAAIRRLTGETPEKPKEQSSAFRAFLCVGDVPGLSSGGFPSRPQGTGVRLFPCLGKQKLSAGPHPEPAACVRGWVLAQTRCANCPAQPRVSARHREEKDGANRFADSRRTKSCIAGDKPACADDPAPGRRVRDLPTAGVLGAAVQVRSPQLMWATATGTGAPFT